MRDPRIVIAGGGVSGMTTAIILQIAGYKTIVRTLAQPSFAPDAPRPPGFATLHAAASVLPHSVVSPHLARWTGMSQAFFQALCFLGTGGVRRQVHYEIFEDVILSPPPYADAVDEFRLLTADDRADPRIPRRSGARDIYGWKFNAFFCEAPTYVRFLYAFYAAIGGEVMQSLGEATLAASLAQGHDILVNCTGMAAHAFLATAANDQRRADAPADQEFEPLADPLPPRLIRGHYLRLDTRRILTNDQGQFLSYSYKPLAEVYGTSKGLPADLYCYPRSDGWVLGGSRQDGAPDGLGRWIGEQTTGETLDIPGPDSVPIAVPAAIVRLNADLLRGLTRGGLDLERLLHDDPGAVTAGIGYRFVRESETDNVRVACSRLDFAGTRKYILHNYGHGGAGYTLSWGCAVDVLRLLSRVAPRPGDLVSDSGRFPLGHAATRSMMRDVLDRVLSRAG